MHKIWALTKIMLKGGSSSDNKKQKSRVWLVLLLLFAFGSFAFSIMFMTFGLYDLLSTMNAASAILPLAFGATSVVIFFFGIFYVVSVMYHANDVQILLGLPLRPYEILSAKLTTLVVYEYIFEAFILIPMLVAYGIKSGADILYIVYSAVLFALLPIIGLVMAAIIVMLVMRFTRFGKNKQVFNFVGGILALGLAIGFNVVVQTSVNDLSADQILALTTGQASLTEMMSRIFPGIGFAANALINSASVAGLWNLLLFVVCAEAGVALFLGFGQLLYFKGLAGVAEAAAKRKALSSQELDKSTASTPVSRAYVLKELRLLTRSPIAFLNCVLMNFLWPVLIIIMLIGGGQMETLKPYIATMNNGLLIAILVGMGAFVSSANAITSTAISREGKTLYFAKFIPVSMKKQLSAKAMSGILLSGIGILLMSGVAVFLGASILTALIAFVLSMVMTVASSYAGLLIDVSRPKLSWMNEQQAIKQNMNVMLHMLLGVVLAAVIIVPVAVAGFSEIVAIAYVAVVSVVLAEVFRQSVISGGAKKLAQMDV
jgi:ABC-2 type transport system permease protein